MPAAGIAPGRALRDQADADIRLDHAEQGVVIFDEHAHPREQPFFVDDMPHEGVDGTIFGKADDVIVERPREAGAFAAANQPPTPALVVLGHASDWRPVLDWYKGRLLDNPIG